MPRIRPAVEQDHPFILSLAPRLAGVAGLAWRGDDELARFQDLFMRHSLAVPGSQGFVAEDEGGQLLGFIHVEPAQDPVHARLIGYVSLLAVGEGAAGQGLGRLLLQRAEEWATAQGYGSLQLDVFAGNGGGRAFYERVGFAEESLRLIKPLG